MDRTTEICELRARLEVVIESTEDSPGIHQHFQACHGLDQERKRLEVLISKNAKEIVAARLAEVAYREETGLTTFYMADNLLAIIQHIRSGGQVLFASPVRPTSSQVPPVRDSEAMELLLRARALYDLECCDVAATVRVPGYAEAGFVETILHASAYGNSPQMQFGDEWVELYDQGRDSRVQKIKVYDASRELDNYVDFCSILEEHGEHEVDFVDADDIRGHITWDMFLLTTKVGSEINI